MLAFLGEKIRLACILPVAFLVLCSVWAATGSTEKAWFIIRLYSFYLSCTSLGTPPNLILFPTTDFLGAISPFSPPRLSFPFLCGSNLNFSTALGTGGGFYFIWSLHSCCLAFVKELFGVARVECGEREEENSAADAWDTGYGTKKRHTLIYSCQ